MPSAIENLGDAVQVGGNCFSFKVRKASRRLIRMYDEALRPTGLGSAQFSLLNAISDGEPKSATDLSHWLDTDRTTLVRNLAVLEKRGLVEQDLVTPGRSKLLRLTRAGEEALAAAIPCWQSVQQQLLEDIGPGCWDQVVRSIDALNRALGVDLPDAQIDAGDDR